VRVGARRSVLVLARAAQGAGGRRLRWLPLLLVLLIETLVLLMLVVPGCELKLVFANMVFMLLLRL